MGSSGGGGDSETTVRYAPYVESKHEAFLDTMHASREAVINDSPFSGYSDIEVNDAFFGTGYIISSFPSLYDMYGKFMAGLDICSLQAQIFEDTVNAPEINDLVAAEADLMDDDIDANILPRFKTGFRDINAVMSSSFITGKAMIEDARVKSLSKFSAQLKYTMIPVATERWKIHLGWNESVIKNYAEIMKLYFSAKMDVDDANYSMNAKDKLWPFTVLDFERAGLGALQGATNTKSDVAGASKAQRAISGAMTGAAAGMMVGGPPGAVIGGVLGLGMAFL